MCITSAYLMLCLSQILHAVFMKNGAVLFCRDNKLLVSGTQDGDLFVWSMDTQSLNQQLPCMFHFHFFFLKL